MCRVTVHETVSYSDEKKVITGKVYDSDGNPLSGISVKIKGTSYGAFTNSSGYYSLKAEPGDYLVVSGSGYKTIEKYVPLSTTTMDFSMASLGSSQTSSSSSGSSSGYQTRQTNSTKIVTGYVRDSQGFPLVGVAVVIRGTTSGTITNVDGVYSLTAKEGDVLLFSSLGYQDAAKTVGSESRIDVTMLTGKNKRR